MSEEKRPLRQKHEPGERIEDDQLAIRDILDSQLQTSDERNIGRVADIVGIWHPDGSYELTHLVTGPEALAGRVAFSLRTLFERLLHNRFEEQIPLSEVEEFGPTVRLRGRADDYRTGASERWIAQHILRWFPGSGYRHETE
jgi:hypothetical protein